MKINKKNILASFTNYDQRVQDMIEYTITELMKLDKTPNEYALVLIQLLADQFEIHFKAKDEVGDSIVQTYDVGDRKISHAKPQFEAQQKAQTQIIRLLDKLGLSPLEKAKIKKLNEKDSLDKNELIKEEYAFLKS